ncbi:MAG TPA: helix-turn-helix domain-containing protein [Bryobacteraceae bacterium]|jgi:hypothetical protein
MASPSFAPQSVRERRLSLAEIDALVSARLGPTRGLGNSQPACFNRQIAMYLAARVGRWSTTIIGRFYGGRDHSTVCYGIQRIESLRDTDPDVDTLLSELKQKLNSRDIDNLAIPDFNKRSGHIELSALSADDLDKLADKIAARVYARLHDDLC